MIDLHILFFSALLYLLAMSTSGCAADNRMSLEAAPVCKDAQREQLEGLMLSRGDKDSFFGFWYERASLVLQNNAQEGYGCCEEMSTTAGVILDYAELMLQEALKQGKEGDIIFWRQALQITTSIHEDAAEKYMRSTISKLVRVQEANREKELLKQICDQLQEKCELLKEIKDTKEINVKRLSSCLAGWRKSMAETQPTPVRQRSRSPRRSQDVVHSIRNELGGAP